MVELPLPQDGSPEFQSITNTRTNRTARTINSLGRSSSRVSQKETTFDPNFDVNVPYRTFSNAANLEEFTAETSTGEIKAAANDSEGEHDYKLVTFTTGDKANPKNWSKAYKWYCTMVVAITCFVVAFASSVVTADIAGVQKEFNVSEEVALLSVTLFVVGFGIGPMGEDASPS